MNNTEKILLEYFKIANVNTMNEFKNTIFYSYYLDEIKKKDKKKIAILKSKELLHKEQVFECSKCHHEIGYIIMGSRFVLPLNTLDFKNKILTVACICGETNIFTIDL